MAVHISQPRTRRRIWAICYVHATRVDENVYYIEASNDTGPLCRESLAEQFEFNTRTNFRTKMICYVPRYRSRRWGEA